MRQKRITLATRFADGGEMNPPISRQAQLNTNPNRLKNESLESFKARQKYNDFRIRQEEDKSPLKKAYNEMLDSQNSDSNFLTKTVRKLATSPIHLASYLHDKINSNDTDQFRSDNKKLKDNVKGVSSTIDAASLLFPFSPKKQTAQGLYSKLAKSAPSLIKQLGSYTGIQAIEQLTQDEVEDFANKKIDNNYADGGQLNNKLDSKYNNYLNNNMRQYAQGGDLTRFDAGGTHEQNPNGGVPQGMAPNGSQNVVEQGESKKGNFIYSNRIELDKGLIKQFSLPGYVANKSVSDASKAIDDKFKDRSDKYAQETKKTLLDRLANAQEYLKQQEQASIDKTNESMQANSQQIPDQMNGQVPEGMEEYAEGANSNPQEEQMEQMQGQQPMPASPIAAFGGYQQHRYVDGGTFSSMNTLDPNAGIGYSFKPQAMTSNSPLTSPSILADGKGTTGTGTSTATTSVAPSVTTAGVVGAATGAFDLAKTAFGKPAQDTSGLAPSAKVDKAGMIGGSAMKGAAAGAALGPIGAGVGALVGAAAGFLGAKKAREAAIENGNNFAINTNNKVSDNYAAYGGMLDITKMSHGGGMNMYVNGGRPQITSVNEIDGIGINSSTGAADIKNFKGDYSNLKTPSKIADITLMNRAKLGLINSKDYLNDNIGDIARLAPVAMNAYQLKNLEKPSGFQYQTLANRYKPQYVDEARMQSIVDQEGNNTMAAIGQMGGSEGATRNAILAMGLNKTKGLSDAYANAAAQNRAQNAAAQQFNLGVDSSNVATNNRAMDEMRADKGAYDTARSKYMSAIGTDIGDIGKEKNASDAAISMFGYTRKGKYVVDRNGNKVSPEVLARRQADYAAYITEQNKKAKV